MIRRPRSSKGKWLACLRPHPQREDPLDRKQQPQKMVKLLNTTTREAMMKVKRMKMTYGNSRTSLKTITAVMVMKVTATKTAVMRMRKKAIKRKKRAATIMKKRIVTTMKRKTAITIRKRRVTPMMVKVKATRLTLRIRMALRTTISLTTKIITQHRKMVNLMMMMMIIRRVDHLSTRRKNQR